MADRIATKRAILPSVEPFKATRPALGIVASALGGATGYEAGVRALRSHVQPFQWMDPLNDDVPSAAAETRRVAYRPSPYALSLYVGIWYATATPYGTTLPGTPPKFVVSLLDDATLLSVDSFNVESLPERRSNSRTANLANSGQTDTTGLLFGEEVYAANTWLESPLNAAALTGGDGWLEVEATAAQILAVGWVEVPRAEVLT